MKKLEKKLTDVLNTLADTTNYAVIWNNSSGFGRATGLSRSGAERVAGFHKGSKIITMKEYFNWEKQND